MAEAARSETTMESAFKRVGMSQRDWRLMSAAWAFLKDGGTVERAHELVAKAAKKLPSEGPTGFAEPGHASNADAGQPEGGGAGHHGCAEDGQHPLASPPPQPSGVVVFHQRGADGQFKPRSPIRRPTAAEIRVAGEVARDGAITIMDTHKIRDGRSIGNIRFGELESLRATNLQEAALFKLIQKHCVADSSTLIRDAIKLDVLQRYLQQSAEVADAW